MTDEMKANYETLLDALTNEMQALHKELQECKEKLSQEPCENCCNGNQIEKAKLCQKSYLAGMEHKQEPCDDAISRQAVIDTIDKWVKSMHVLIALPANEVTPLFESVHELPSVTPMQKWIPCSERLPEEGVSVLVYAERNAYDGKGKFRKKVIDIGWQVDGHWHIDGCNGVVGIAWMPLPEPYKPEVEE